MTGERDPHHMPAASPPSLEELAESERLVEELRAGLLGFSSDPAIQLLNSARGPASVDELTDTVDFAALATTAAVAEPVSELASVSVPTGSSERSARRRHIAILGRVIATKAAVIAAVGVVGVAGAGAATGVFVATRSEPVPISSTSSTTKPEPANAADSGSARVGQSETGPTSGPNGPAPTQERSITPEPDAVATLPTPVLEDPLDEESSDALTPTGEHSPTAALSTGAKADTPGNTTTADAFGGGTAGPADPADKKNAPDNSPAVGTPAGASGSQDTAPGKSKPGGTRSNMGNGAENNPGRSSAGGGPSTSKSRSTTVPSSTRPVAGKGLGAGNGNGAARSEVPGASASSHIKTAKEPNNEQ